MYTAATDVEFFISSISMTTKYAALIDTNNKQMSVTPVNSDSGIVLKKPTEVKSTLSLEYIINSY